MNNKQDIIKEVEHYINGKYNLGIIDDKVVKDCINKTLEAINYTRCSAELSKRPNTSSTWECFSKADKQQKGNV